MDNYINLAELRKTAEAILVKMQDKLDEKIGMNDFILEGKYNSNNDYEINLITDKSFAIPYSWVYNIADSRANYRVNNALSNITSFKVSVVSTLPSSGSSDTFYFLSKTGTTGDVYDEYMYINNQWEKIGTTAIDLNGYLKTTDIADWAKASTKPSYTASEVGAAASSHTHGNITSGGDITTTATIASGDRLIINDESASKLTNSSITFGTSTSQYLANNGTWQSVPTTLPASDVSAWAKATTKPTYTASEVGALASNTSYVKSFNGKTGVVTYTAPVTSVNGKTGEVSLAASDIGIDTDSFVKTSSTSTLIADHYSTSTITNTNGSIKLNSQYIDDGLGDVYGDAWLYVGYGKVKIYAAGKENNPNFLLDRDETTTIRYLNTPTDDTDAANKKYVDDKFAAVSYPVTSVNSKTGAVTLSASDVGALPSTTTYVSSVNGQTGTVTITDSDEKVKYTPLQGTDTNSYGILLAQNNGTTEQTTTAYTGKIRFTPSTARLTIYSSDGARAGILTPFNLGLKHRQSRYGGDLVIDNLTDSRTYTLPDADGTIALTSDIPTVPTNISSFTNDSGYLTSYTETDPVFAASAAAGITATDISNWNAKVSDDKTWNGVTLSLSSTYTSANQYVPVKQTNSLSGSASQIEATQTPTQYRIAKYDDNACLNSTTPAATDNSKKVATTAYVKTAISNIAIPAAQVQSDWNATSGMGVILNKPAYMTETELDTMLEEFFPTQL